MGPMRRYSIILILLLSVPAAAQINQAFQREVVFQRIQNGRVIQEHVRRSQFVRDDQGRLVETVLFKTPNIKGVSDREVEDFASGRKMKEIEGVSQFARYYGYKRFETSVEVKDVWDAHWPSGSKVKVYFSSDFRNDLPVLLEVLTVWNSLIPEIRFDYAGTAEQTQQCEGCLTVLKTPSLGSTGRLYWGERGDGVIVTARIELGVLDRKTLFTALAHEIGHSLGLPHNSEGLMKPVTAKGKKVFPSQVEVDLVRKILSP